MKILFTSLTPDQYKLLDDLLAHREYQLEEALNEKPLPSSGNIALDMEEQRVRQEELTLAQRTREALVIHCKTPIVLQMEIVKKQLETEKNSTIPETYADPRDPLI